MSTKPLSSIVLPTHNGATYLAGAIESVLRQTRSDWELIIVESDSTDETPQIAARYAAQDTRIQVIQHPKAAGRLPGALNAGFAIARGQYHTWLSDDNEMQPTALERLVGYLDDHPEIGLVYSDFLVSYEDGTIPHAEKRPSVDLLPSKNVITPSFLYRASIHETIGGYRNHLFLAEDYDFFLRAYDHIRFHHIDDPLQLYRFHAAGLTAAAQREAIDQAVKASLIDNLQQLRWLREGKSRALAFLYLYELAQRHQWPDARFYWGEAFRADPVLVLRRTILTSLPSTPRQWITGLYRRFRQ